MNIQWGCGEHSMGSVASFHLTHGKHCEPGTMQPTFLPLECAVQCSPERGVGTRWRREGHSSLRRHSACTEAFCIT